MGWKVVAEGRERKEQRATGVKVKREGKDQWGEGCARARGWRGYALRTDEYSLLICLWRLTLGKMMMLVFKWLSTFPTLRRCLLVRCPPSVSPTIVLGRLWCLSLPEHWCPQLGPLNTHLQSEYNSGPTTKAFCSGRMSLPSPCFLKIKQVPSLSLVAKPLL